jgi:hypothetical protein
MNCSSSVQAFPQSFKKLRHLNILSILRSRSHRLFENPSMVVCLKPRWVSFGIALTPATRQPECSTVAASTHVELERNFSRWNEYHYFFHSTRDIISKQGCYLASSRILIPNVSRDWLTFTNTRFPFLGN